LGEADFPAVSNNIQAAMSGKGEVYYKGVRTKAAQALQQAGLKPIKPSFGGAENAYGDARAALLVADGRQALEWVDLIYALDKIGMNSSITPMVTPVQAQRPFKWVNWDAARVMDILKGSYLFEDDPKRILQDPQSMRASYVRQGSAWQAWAALRDSVQLQINSSDLNPMVILDGSPSDSWELSTPQMMRYYVKGGPLSHGQHGFVFSTANWDPYPMANDIEAFTNAVANMDIAVAQRIERFTDRSPTPFFTGIKPADVLTPEQIKDSPALSEPFWVFLDLWQEIQSLSQSLAPEGHAADAGVADIDSETRLKASRGQQVIDLTMQLLGYDLWNATYWMDLRKTQDSSRNFGPVATGVWTAFRKVLPWQQDPETRPEIPYGIVAYTFLKSTPAGTFYPGGPVMPTTDGTLGAARPPTKKK
jgi:histidine ammonia-lyase